MDKFEGDGVKGFLEINKNGQAGIFGSYCLFENIVAILGGFRDESIVDICFLMGSKESVEDFLEALS